MSYNRSGGTRTLTGNWVEERQLEAMTGTARYRSWVSDDPDAEAKPLTRKNKKPEEETNGRVVAHSQAMDAKDFKSVNRATHVRPDSVEECKVPDSVGPRARRRMQQLEAKARELEAEPLRRAPPSYFETTAGSSYQAHAADLAAVGGASGGGGGGGGTAKEAALAEELAKTHYTEGVACTVYSEAIGDRPGPRFAMSAVNPANPFARSAAFTNDIADSSLRHAEGVDLVSNVPSGLGVTAHQTTALERVRAKLQRRADHNGTRGMSLLLAGLDRNNNGTVSRAEFSEGLRRYGVSLEDDEMRAVFATFDRDGSDSLSITELMRGIRGEMSPARRELVARAFAMLDRAGDGCVTLADLVECYDVSAVPGVAAGEVSPQAAARQVMQTFDVVGGDGVITIEDFLEAYNDISAGIEDDGYFELMIRNAWHISGGVGAAANTSCRRVCVVHSDDSQEIVEIKNDLGLRADDVAGMRRRLEAQGVADIKAIKLTA